MKKLIVLGLLLVCSYKQINTSPLVTKIIGALAVIGRCSKTGLEHNIGTTRNVLLLMGVYGMLSGLYLIGEYYHPHCICPRNNSSTDNQ